MGSVVDSRRIIQTLLNTEHIENQNKQSQIGGKEIEEEKQSIQENHEIEKQLIKKRIYLKLPIQ